MPDAITEHDSDLIQRAMNDPDAFHALYHHYFQRIFAYVASRIGDHRDTEDVVSEIFLHVVKNLDQLRNKRHTSFAAWLFVIARNTITDYYRRNGRTDPPLPLDVAHAIPTMEPPPEQIATINDEAAQLHRMILTLPERKREIITLRYYGGLRNQEIAVVLGIGEKTVSAYLSRALHDLQGKYALLTHDYETQRSTNETQ